MNASSLWSLSKTKDFFTQTCENNLQAQWLLKDNYMSVRQDNSTWYIMQKIAVNPLCNFIQWAPPVHESPINRY